MDNLQVWGRGNMSEEEIKQVKLKLTKILNKLGFKANWLGRKYWITSVLELIRLRKNNLYENKLGYFYTYVSKRHRTTYSKAEEAMRYCIKHNRAKIQEYFNLDYKINNSAFLQLLYIEICYS